MWHREILRLQGYLASPISQYFNHKTLADGYYGTVKLSSHKNSGFLVVTKTINKSSIEHTFSQMKEAYAAVRF